MAWPEIFWYQGVNIFISSHRFVVCDVISVSIIWWSHLINSVSHWTGYAILCAGKYFCFQRQCERVSYNEYMHQITKLSKLISNSMFYAPLTLSIRSHWYKDFFAEFSFHINQLSYPIHSQIQTQIYSQIYEQQRVLLLKGWSWKFCPNALKKWYFGGFLPSS